MSGNLSRKTPTWASLATVVIIICIIAVNFVACGSGSKKSSEAAKVKQVEVVRAVRDEIRDELELSGTIEPESRVTIFPEIAGTIIVISAEEGDQVEEGQTLAVIEHEKLSLQEEQAEAAYQSAQAAYEQAKKLARVRVESQVAQARAQLAGAESTRQQVLDLAETRTASQVGQAEASLASLQANLEKIIRGAREEDRKQAQATVNQAKANFSNAESNYKRMKTLFESGAISSQSFEQAQTQLDVSQAQYEVAVQQMTLIEEGAREEDIEAMKSQVKRAEAALDLARAQAETKSWEKDIALAESQAEAASAALKSAEALEVAKSWEAEITHARATADQARAALDLARRVVADATITAPVTGVVSRRYLDRGAKALPGAPIFEIVNVETVKAVVSVLESDMNKVKLKDKAWIQVGALSEPVPGVVSLISPILELTKRSVKVEITIDNDEMGLRPGMFAKVTIPVEVHNNVIIPLSTIIEDNPQDTGTVFVVADGKSNRRKVDLGLSQGNVIEVTRGLAEGEFVVTAGQHSIQDGQKVTVTKP